MNGNADASRSAAAHSDPPIVLTGAELTVADVELVALGRRGVRLDPGARRRVGEARAVIDRLVASGEVVYGVTTGFGSLASTFVPPERARELQERLLLSHAAGVGEPLPTPVVRAMLLLRANTLALGHSGCRPELIERLCEMLANGLHPVVPSQGSVGASGDLAPLAHLALPLIGHGTVELQGRLQPAAEALAVLGLAPLVLEPKEGLALLNGTQMMTAIGALALAAAERLARTASVAAAMSTEALRGTEVAFSAAYQSTRPHPGQVRTAAELRWLLRDSELQRSHHADSHRVQDPYSLRCVPQVHGAARDALAYLHGVLDIEMNSATDNPLVFPEGGHVPEDALATGHGLVISGGNFHGEPVALALDLAKLAIAELGAISERRVALLLDPRLNDGLPAFLGAASGLDSGLDRSCSTRQPPWPRNRRCWHIPPRPTRSPPRPTRRTTSRWAPSRRSTCAASSSTPSASWVSSSSAPPRRWTSASTRCQARGRGAAWRRPMHASVAPSPVSSTIVSRGRTWQPPDASSGRAC